jgi:DNA-binding transcriptional MerR regulator
VADGQGEYSISEVATLTGLSAHTLRWYERIGLMAPVERETNGRRRYLAHDLEWLRLLSKLRATGMPVADMVRYAELVREGDGTVAARQRLLERHRGRVLRAIQEQQDTLRLLDYKINMYAGMTMCEGGSASAQGNARIGA